MSFLKAFLGYDKHGYNQAKENAYRAAHPDAPTDNELHMDTSAPQNGRFQDSVGGPPSRSPSYEDNVEQWDDEDLHMQQQAIFNKFQRVVDRLNKIIKYDAFTNTTIIDDQGVVPFLSMEGPANILRDADFLDELKQHMTRLLGAYSIQHVDTNDDTCTITWDQAQQDGGRPRKQLSAMTKDELYALARAAGVRGRSGMDKAQLVRALRASCARAKKAKVPAKPAKSAKVPAKVPAKAKSAAKPPKAKPAKPAKPAKATKAKRPKPAK